MACDVIVWDFTSVFTFLNSQIRHCAYCFTSQCLIATAFVHKGRSYMTFHVGLVPSAWHTLLQRGSFSVGLRSLCFTFISDGLLLGVEFYADGYFLLGFWRYLFTAFFLLLWGSWESLSLRLCVIWFFSPVALMSCLCAVQFHCGGINKVFCYLF